MKLSIEYNVIEFINVKDKPAETCCYHVTDKMCEQLMFRRYGQTPVCDLFRTDLEQDDKYFIIPSQECLEARVKQNGR